MPIKTQSKINIDEKPEAEFLFPIASARAYCNLHGLWKSK